MRTCSVCRSILHCHAEEPPGRLTVDQDGRRADYWVCGECLEVIEARLNSRGHRLPFPNPPLTTITRTGPRPA
jgi:hypothetical protein